MNPMKGTVGNALLPPHRRDDGRGTFDPTLAYLSMIRELAVLRGVSSREHGNEERLLYALDRVWESLDGAAQLQVEAHLKAAYGGRFTP